MSEAKHHLSLGVFYTPDHDEVHCDPVDPADTRYHLRGGKECWCVKEHLTERLPQLALENAELRRRNAGLERAMHILAGEIADLREAARHAVVG